MAIHVGDPEAFFLPIDRFNERYEELNAHPDWSFYGKDFPAFKEILDARDRVFARHPKTTFVALHVGHWAENLAAVGEMLDKFRNVNVEIGARIGELGRQPRTAARFFDKYQDRVLFGTDAIPLGTETPQQVFGDGPVSNLLPLPRNGRRVTSTMRRRSCRRKAAGASTVSGCGSRSCARCITRTRSGAWVEADRSVSARQAFADPGSLHLTSGDCVDALSAGCRRHLLRDPCRGERQEATTWRSRSRFRRRRSLVSQK